MFEGKRTDVPFIRQDGDSIVTEYRIFIEKRSKITDIPGKEGVFVIIPNGITNISTSGSVDGNTGSATITSLKNSDCFYIPFGNQRNKRQIDDYVNRVTTRNNEYNKLNTEGRDLFKGEEAYLKSITDTSKTTINEVTESNFQDQFNRFRQDINNAISAKNFEFFLPNRDPSIDSTTAITKLKSISPVLPELISEAEIKPETLLMLEVAEDYFSQIEAGDLIYIDTYSKRKNKMLPTFTGVITRKRESGSAGGIETFQFDCEDYSYFLKNSQYLYSPTVFNEAQREVLLGTKSPGQFTASINNKDQLQNPSSDRDSIQHQISLFQSNLMDKGAFEAFLALFLTSSWTENPLDYLDSNGKIVRELNGQPIYSVIPLRAPLLSRMERILAYPLTKAVAESFQFMQGSAKSRHELMLELARNLEVEFFFAETGEPVLKFPTRIDAFKFMPPVNLLPGNNLGISRVHDTYVNEAGTSKVEQIYKTVVSKNKKPGNSPKAVEDKSRDSFFVESQLVKSSIYINMHNSLRSEFEKQNEANERIISESDLVTITKTPEELVDRVVFKPYQKKNWEDYLYVDPRSEYLTSDDRMQVLRRAMQSDRLSEVDQLSSTQYQANFSAESKSLPRPTYEAKNDQSVKSISSDVLEGGEIPVLYDEDIISWDFEDNVEEVFTSGFVTISLDYLPGATQDNQTAQVTNRGRYFVDVANAEKYGTRYKDLSPQFFRDQYYGALYAYTKLAIVNQERFRAQVTAINDPFIRVGTPIKLNMRRNVKIRRVVPSEPLSVLDFEALQKEESLRFDDSTILKALRFNTPTNNGKILFEVHEVNIPCIYYIHSISRTLPVGDGVPTMQLQLTAGRPEFNSKITKGSGPLLEETIELSDAEDQWVRGFYFFYRNFMFNPRNNMQPYLDKLSKDTSHYDFKTTRAVSNTPSKNPNVKKQEPAENKPLSSEKPDDPKAFGARSVVTNTPDKIRMVLQLIQTTLIRPVSNRITSNPQEGTLESRKNQMQAKFVKISNEFKKQFEDYLGKGKNPARAIELDTGIKFIDSIQVQLLNYDLYRSLFGSRLEADVVTPFTQDDVKTALEKSLGIDLTVTAEEKDKVYDIIYNLLNKELIPTLKSVLKL